MSLSKHLREAIKEACTHRIVHTEFTATFSQDKIRKWASMIDKWNEDPFNNEDPYAEPEPGKPSTTRSSCT